MDKKKDQGEPAPLDRSTERIAVAVERIGRTLEGRPVGSRRHAALVALLGEAPRAVRPAPAPAQGPHDPRGPHGPHGPHGPQGREPRTSSAS